MNNQISTTSSEASQKEHNQIILYRPNDTISLEVRLENETVWLTQEMMSDLFQRNKSTISRHIKNIFQEKELLFARPAIGADLIAVQADGFQHAVQALIAQRVEAELLADALKQALAALRRAVGIFFHVVLAFVALQLLDDAAG